jgi:heat shock protein HtpX
MNSVKTFLLMTVLTVILVMLGNVFGGRGGMVIALIFAACMNFFSYWFSDKIVLRMYGAREVSESEAPILHKMVEKLSQRAGLPKPKVYIVPMDIPNAFATGRNPSNAAVAVTTGIMNLLSEDELFGVLGHEMSHIKHRDILVQTIAATMAGAISMIANWAQWGAMFGGFGDDDEGANFIFVLVFSIIASIAAMLIQMAISRSREYMADETGAKLSGNPLYLANALRKLHAASMHIPAPKINPATAHMFIVSPLSGGGRAILNLFSTHPPIEERISKLESMAAHV